MNWWIVDVKQFKATNNLCRILIQCEARNKQQFPNNYNCFNGCNDWSASTENVFTALFPLPKWQSKQGCLNFALPSNKKFTCTFLIQTHENIPLLSSGEAPEMGQVAVDCSFWVAVRSFRVQHIRGVISRQGGRGGRNNAPAACWDILIGCHLSMTST